MATYKWVVLSNTTIASLMAAIDLSIVLISLPTILNDLPGTGAGEGIWIVMSYMLVTATFLVNLGRLGDMFGRVKMYNIGFAFFTFGSFLCSISGTGLELVIFRVVQGIGSSFLFANSAAIITDTFPLNERGRALGINQVAIVSGSVVGLVLGGILTVSLGWRSIFWVNVPIGIFGTVWSHYKLKETASIRRGQKLDLMGNLTFVAGLTLLLFGLTFGALVSWSNLIIGSMITGGFLLVAFFVIETKTPDPMFDLTLFRNRIFNTGNISILCISLARGAFSFMMVFYLQSVLGFDPFTAGLLLVPMSAFVVIFGPLSGWLSDKYGPRFFTSAGMAASGVAFLILTRLPAEMSYGFLLIPLILLGAGMGLFSSPNRSETLSSVPAARRGVAAGINSTIMNVANLLSLGVSVVLISASVPHAVIGAVFGGATSGAVKGIDVLDFMVGLHDVYYLSAFLCFLGIFPVFIGFKNAREQITLLYEKNEAPKLGSSSIGIQSTRPEDKDKGPVL